MPSKMQLHRVQEAVQVLSVRHKPRRLCQYQIARESQEFFTGARFASVIIIKAKRFRFLKILATAGHAGTNGDEENPS